jgi:WD40 repeat protein
MKACPPQDQLAALLADRLADAQAQALEAHLENCLACQQVLEQLTRADTLRDHCSGQSFLRRLEQQPPSLVGFEPTPTVEPPPRETLTGWPVIPGYEILGELDRGGMGIVYQARDTQLNRVVALKVILAGSHAGAAELARFRTEAQAIARMQHPNIVQVFEVGEHDSKPFLALEFCPGGSLDKKLAGTPLPASEAARLVETLARAMQAAHQALVIHRDLKPANVLLTADGTPKITDFGLARKLDEVGRTASNAIVGTPSYMAPEQAGGKTKEIGPAADIYALGAILYELLTGRPPFKAATALDTLMQVVNDEPVPPSQFQSKTPRDLETICLKCLRKEPVKRYASALELAEDLARFQAGESIRARPVGAGERVVKWARRRPAAAALLAVSVLAAVSLVAGGVFFTARLAEQVKRAERARNEADLLVIRSGIDRATGLCEQGDIDQGLLWWADSLEKAERAGAADFERVIRSNLAHWRGRIHPLLGCLEHRDEVRAIAFAPTGRLAATGSADGTVQIWDVTTGQKVGPVLKHEQPILAVHFSPDGKVLVTVAGRSATLWNAATCARRHRSALVHSADISSVAFHPSGTSLLLAGKDGKAQLWDTVSGRPVGVPLGHEGSIQAATFSPDGTLLATASSDRTARLWHGDSGKPAGIPPLRHSKPVSSVAFRPDGLAVLTGSGDGTAQVWAVATGARIGTPLKHNARVNVVRFSPDGDTIVTGSQDWNACVWDARSAALRAKLPHQAPVDSLDLSPDGTILLTGSRDGKARLWTLATGQLFHTPLPHPGEVRVVAFAPDGRTVLTAGHEHAARLWAVTAPPVHPPWLDHPGWAFAMAFSPDGRWLATPFEDHGVQLWNTQTGKKGPHLEHPGLVRAVAFSPDGRFLVTGGKDRQARCWRVETGASLGPGLPHGEEVSAAAFSPDGRLLFTGTMTENMPGTVRCWERTTGKRLGSWVAHKGPVWGMACSPDGRWLLTASADHRARLWEVATEALQATLRHQGMVWSVAFTPDGTAALTGSADHTARLWEVPSGTPIGAPFHERGPVRTVTVRSDGRVVLLGGTQHGARLWDVPTRKPLTAPLLHDGPVLAAAFAGDGEQIRTAAEDKALTLWKLPSPMFGTAEQILLRMQVITGMELEPGGTARVLDAAEWQERRRRLVDAGGSPR